VRTKVKAGIKIQDQLMCHLRQCETARETSAAESELIAWLWSVHFCFPMQKCHPVK